MKIRRRWVYCHSPDKYQIQCDKCNGATLDWSEFTGLVWCYDCKIDTPGTKGVFDGPIPINMMAMMGVRFDRISIRTSKISRFNLETGKYGRWEGKCPTK